MSASWGHALNPPDAFSEFRVAVERAIVVAMIDVLAEAEDLAAAGSPLIVKVNAEGEECVMILGTPPQAWRAVSELFVEVHPCASCTAEELAAHLALASLTEAPSAASPVLRLIR